MQTEGAPIWSQAQKRSSGSGCRGRVDEGKTWTRVSQHRGRPAASLSKVGLLLVGYLMQCHEAYQAPNQHRREEGRRPSNLPGTCQLGTLLCGLPSTNPCFPPALGRMPRMQSPGGLLVVRRGSWSPQWLGVAAHVPLVPRYDKVRRDGSGFRAGHVVAGHVGEIDGQEWAPLSGRWVSDVQIWQLADW
ncbi:hypothetical protein QBC32DRAFT_10066 [Pseudoneurospora amorphoporcata]|uniref:Uncharacterized protein n=1 Tax=Pseudoneurospora amorphoporcata TaxID=241081 RepID=A0AAN6P1K4_9PEZI|nr:hypothetical protein QBC32DRAFT_10066 [Pseudoneurospora amorphoporcata]